MSNESCEVCHGSNSCVECEGTGRCICCEAAQPVQETSKPADLLDKKSGGVVGRFAGLSCPTCGVDRADHVAEVERLTKQITSSVMCSCCGSLLVFKRNGDKTITVIHDCLSGKKARELYARAELAESKLSQLQQERELFLSLGIQTDMTMVWRNARAESAEREVAQLRAELENRS